MNGRMLVRPGTVTLGVGEQFIAPSGIDRPPGGRNELLPYIFGRTKTHSLLRQLADDLPGQRAFMDLVRSIDQVKCAAMRPHRGQREIVANTSTTEDLDGTVDDIGEHGRRDD